jgi:Fur family ferric uptake transcriptional regulator
MAQQETEALGLLEGAGVRATRQRVVVLGELMRERNDVTAQELHERLRARGERLGLATVYRTLGLLAEEGVVDALSHHRGELCYRWCGGGHHHHLVCTECHRVVEIDECELHPWLERLGESHGFAAVAHHLEITGVCRECR